MTENNISQTASLPDFAKVPESSPDYATARYNMGVILYKRGAIDEARARFEEAVAHTQDELAPWMGLGQAAAARDDFERAEIAYRRATEVAPDAALGHTRLAETLRFLKRYDEAVVAARRAVELAPDDDLVLANLLYVQMKACDWTDITILRDRTADVIRARGVRGEPIHIQPFQSIVSFTDPKVHRLVADSRIARLKPGKAPVAAPAGERITLGYLSAGFGDHPTGRLTRSLFARHDRARFRVLGLSLKPSDGSALAREIRAGFDSVLELGALPNDAAAAAIRQAGVDVLVDLHGWLQGNRAGILARRPAPVQVNYLGFPGTAGRGLHDYILLDDVIAPPETHGDYGEQVARIGGGYQVNDARDFVRPGVWADGRPAGKVVLCSFNMPYKICPDVFGAWCQILEQTPESVLWLFDDGPVVRANLCREAKVRGLDPDRLVFGQPLARGDHIHRLSAADIGLDTWICGGHTTTTDCLFAGVPVITRLGKTFAGRVAASLMTHAGLAECVATSAEDYVAKAVALAKDPVRLRAMREGLLTEGPRRPLFDLTTRVRLMEGAYAEMIRRHRAGESHRPLRVASA